MAESYPKPGDGGNVNIIGGTGGPDGPGAPINIIGGAATPYGPGAPINIVGGAGGNLVIQRPAAEPPVADTQPDDSAWVLISKLEPPRIVNLTERRRYIEQHKDIRTRRPIAKKTGKPHPKQLEVHIGDWIKHWDKVNRRGFDSLDETAPAAITPDALTEDIADGARKLYADIFQGKQKRQE